MTTELQTTLRRTAAVRCIRLLGFCAEKRPQKISENSCCNAKRLRIL